MKSSVEITEEIVKLHEIKPKVPHYNFFNANNHAAIDAQILVLERRMNEEVFFNIFESSQHLPHAEEALNWMYDEPESVAPSKDWQELVDNLK